MSVTAQRSLATDHQGTYRLSQEIDLWLLTFSESSVFRVDPDGQLRTIRYQQQQVALGHERAVDQHFNWVDRWVKSDYKGDPRYYLIDDKTLDPLNFQLQLQLDLLHEHQQGKALNYHVTGRSSLKTDYTLTFTGNDQVETALGTLATNRVRMLRGDGSRIDVWMAHELQNLPVKALFTDTDGAISRVDIISYQPS